VKDEYATDEFKVVDVVTPSRVVLNCGWEKGVALGDTFRVYSYGDMLTDPDTGEELEQLILPRGRGKVVYLQKKICTIESTATKTVRPFGPSTFYSMMLTPTEVETAPFDSPERGDKAKFVPPPPPATTSKR
jgi:hypothetical protein